MAIKYHELPNIDEEITEAEVNEATAPKSLPVGKFWAKCIKSEGKEVNGIVCAVLTWEVLKIMETEKEADHKDNLIGVKVTNDIALYSAGEQSWVKNRRIMVAKRLGLIPPKGGSLTAHSWSEEVLGTEVCLNITRNTYTPKKGKNKDKEVTFIGIDMWDGYSLAKKPASTEETFDL